MYDEIGGRGLQASALLTFYNTCRAQRSAAVKATATKKALRLAKFNDKAYMVISRSVNIVFVKQTDLNTLLVFP